MADKLTRRKFMRDSAIAGAAVGAGISLSCRTQPEGAQKADTGKILNYDPEMEYRRCGRTGMMISAVTRRIAPSGRSSAHALKPGPWEKPLLPFQKRP